MKWSQPDVGHSVRLACFTDEVSVGPWVLVSARDERLYHRLQVAAHAVQKYSDRVVKQATGLTTAQVSVLTVVSAGEHVTQSEVARIVGVNESAVTTMVTRLEARGCLLRTPHEDDGRAWVLQVTDAGVQALVAARSAFASVNRILDSTLSADDLAGLGSALESIRAAFVDQHPDPPGTPRAST